MPLNPGRAMNSSSVAEVRTRFWPLTWIFHASLMLETTETFI